nr:hypothetical protein BaRGS_026178 [Batillaria attramentaria]
MIYVDNPVGVGYSYTRDDAGLSTSMDDVSRNLYSVLTQFFKMFPEFSENEFYIGGQMMPVFPDFLFNMGFISDYRRRELRETYTKLIRDGLSGKNLLSPSEYLHRFFSKPSYSANHVLGSEATVTSKLHLVDIWMNEASTRAALHVAWARYPKVYAHSYVVRNSLKHEFLQDTVRENAFLMDNYKVLHYSGNLDVIVNVPMTEAFLSSVPWSGQAAYNRSDLTPWWIGKVVGYFTQIANFTRVIVRNSGHMLPYDTPEWALKMMERFVFDIPFETNAHYMDYYS